mmetsp:Transcript_128764/g.364190  ORF Transcript_128764/g.364190 Transcript_128764/m.364190 type:complete len:193 (-) Transcript_128764:19-597(-)
MDRRDRPVPAQADDGGSRESPPDRAPGTAPASPRRPLSSETVPPVESIAAWLSSSLLFKEKHMMAEPGRLYYHGVPAGMDPRIQEMLQTVANHDKGHCVRYGFLHQARAMVRRGGHDCTDDWSGAIRMYVSHFPCIACIAVFSQFIRFFPAVRLELDFDDMRQPAPEGRKPHAWAVHDVMAGEVLDIAPPDT